LTSPAQFASRLRSLVASVSGVLTPEDRELVEHLIDHDEGGEALTSLAWIVVDGNKQIPRPAMDEFLKLAEGLVDPRYMPEGFESHVVDAP
jgi:hypothetical protein